jgi:hypothetical protein
VVVVVVVVGGGEKAKYFRTWYEIVYKQIGRCLAEKSAVWEENA